MHTKKSKRGANYSKTDIRLLVGLIAKYEDIFQSKKIDGVTLKKKDQTWKQLTEEFNEKSSHFRSVSQIREKYKNIKKNRKKPKYEKDDLYDLYDSSTTLIQPLDWSVNDLKPEMDQDDYYAEESPPATPNQFVDQSGMTEESANKAETFKSFGHGIDYRKSGEYNLAGREELLVLEKRILEKQLENLEIEREQSATEHLLRVELLKYQIKAFKEKTFPNGTN